MRDQQSKMGVPGEHRVTGLGRQEEWDDNVERERTEIISEVV